MPQGLSRNHAIDQECIMIGKQDIKELLESAKRERELVRDRLYDARSVDGEIFNFDLLVQADLFFSKNAPGTGITSNIRFITNAGKVSITTLGLDQSESIISGLVQEFLSSDLGLGFDKKLEMIDSRRTIRFQMNGNHVKNHYSEPMYLKVLKYFRKFPEQFIDERIRSYCVEINKGTSRVSILISDSKKDAGVEVRGVAINFFIRQKEAIDALATILTEQNIPWTAVRGRAPGSFDDFSRIVIHRSVFQ
jgi:hypothetical protein